MAELATAWEESVLPTAAATAYTVTLLQVTAAYATMTTIAMKTVSAAAVELVAEMTTTCCPTFGVGDAGIVECNGATERSHGLHAQSAGHQQLVG